MAGIIPRRFYIIIVLFKGKINEMSDSSVTKTNLLTGLGAKTKKYVDVLYLVALFLYLADSACSLTYKPPVFCGYLVTASTVVFVIVAIYRMAVEFSNNMKKAACAFIFLLIGAACSLFINDGFALAVIACAVVGAMGVNSDHILGAGLAGNVVLVISNLVTSFLIDPSTLVTEIQQRDFFYLRDSLYVSRFNNRSATDMGAHYFWMAAAYVWIRGKKITWGEIVALAALNALVYSLTGSSNSLLCISILIVVAVVVKLYHLINKDGKNNKFTEGLKKIISVCSKISFAIICAVCVIIACCFNLTNPVITRINSLFHERFSYGYRGIVEYGIHLFASDVPNYGINTSADGYYNFIDNSYLNILVGSGVVLLLFYVISLTAIQIRHKKFIYGAVILAVCALSCVEEHHLAELPYNFFLLLLFADIDEGKKNSTVTKFRKPVLVNIASFTAFALLVVAVVGVNYPRFERIKLLDSVDARAGEIYLSVQRNLEISDPRIFAAMSSDQYGEVLVNPEDFKSVTGMSWNDAVSNPKAHSYYSFYYDGNSADTSEMAEILLSSDTKDLIGKGSVVIEYDIASGKVYSVWYSNTSGCNAIADGRNNRAERFRTVNPEGYYTGVAHG